MHFSISWLGLVVNGHFLRDTILPVFSSLQTIIFWRVPPPQLAEQKLQPPNSHTYLSLALLSSRFKKYLRETVVEIPWCIVSFATISYGKFTSFKIEENWCRIENMVIICFLSFFSFFFFFYCILIMYKILKLYFTISYQNDDIFKRSTIRLYGIRVITTFLNSKGSTLNDRYISLSRS